MSISERAVNKFYQCILYMTSIVLLIANQNVSFINQVLSVLLDFLVVG